MPRAGQKVLDEYLQRARLGRERFLEQHQHLFLVRVAPPKSGRDDPWDDDLSFATRVQGMSTDDDDDDDFQLATQEIGWIIAPLLKREGGPFPDRIGVGRARNCDVVLRFSNISKLHAQFRVGQPLSLVDLGSANGTKLNGESLTARVPRPVEVGDRVEFGGIELKLTDAAGLYAMLTG